MKKKIALILSIDPESGGEYQYSLSILDAVSSLEKESFKIYIIFFNDIWRKHFSSNTYNVYKVKKNILSRILRKILSFFPFGLICWRFVNKYVDPFHKLLYKIRPDLVIYAANFKAMYASKLPSLMPIFDLMHRYEPSFPEVGSNKVYKRREKHFKNVCNYARGILVDSKIGKEQVIESYKADSNKVFILPYIAPYYIYSNSNFNNDDVLLKYKLPSKYIFYPAQLWKHKNHIGLLKAIYILKKRKIFINAVFVGSKKNGAKEIFKTIKEYKLEKQIFYLEYVSNDEIVSLYRNAIALVMPTFFGPTNIPQLEAFALGCPVATSKVYSIPDQVSDAALLFNPNDARDIAEKIYSLWSNENIRKKLIEKGYKMNDNWNKKQFNSRFIKIVKNIVFS